jgi:hypothetical protein
MAAVNLDYLADRHSSWAGVIALAIGVTVLMTAVWYYRGLSREISDQEVLVLRLLERGNSRSISPVAETRDAEQIARETKQANAAILALSLPWKQLFEAIEATRTNEVAVLAIEPDAQKGLVRISAEAKKLESMLDYVSSLQKIVLFREVLILNHQIQDQDPQKPIRFVLQATWEIQH